MTTQKPQMLTPKQWGKLHGVATSTVLSWIKKDWIPGVIKTELPSGGWHYSIPADAPRPNTKPGPKTAVNPLVLKELSKYGGDKLTEEEIESIKQNHADHFFDLAQQGSHKLTGAEATAWLDRLDYERENLRAALDYFHTTESAASRELQMAVFLGHFWEIRGHWAEGIEILQRALAKQQSGSPLKAKALARLGHLAILRDDYALATKSLSESTTMSRALNDKECLAYSLLGLGLIHYTQGRHQEAKPLLAESLQLSQEANIEWLTSWTYRWLGSLAEAEKDYALAKEHYQQYLKRSEKLQSAIGMAGALDSLGVIAREEGDYDTARRYHERSLALRLGIGIKNGVAYCYFRMGQTEEATGQNQMALTYFHKSLSLHQETGNRLGIARAMEGIARTLGSGKEKEAARILGAADTLRASIGTPLSSSEQAQYGQIIASAKDDSRSDWHKGSKWPLDEAIEYALSLWRDTTA